MYAFVVSIVLFSVGGVFSVYEGVHKIQHPEPLTNAWLPITVLVLAVVMEVFSLRTAVVESNRVRAGQGWVQFVRRAKAPELPVVLLEDVAALIGLLLVVVALVLGVETKSLLLGEGAGATEVALIEAAILDGDEVGRILHMKTLYLGPDELLVAAKVAVRAGETAAGVAAAIDAIEARVRAAVPVARVIYLEPDLDRSREGSPPLTDRL